MCNTSLTNLHTACCVFKVLVVALFRKKSLFSVIIYTEGRKWAVGVALGGFFAARKRKGGLKSMALKIKPKQRTKIICSFTNFATDFIRQICWAKTPLFGSTLIFWHKSRATLAQWRDMPQWEKKRFSVSCSEEIRWNHGTWELLFFMPCEACPTL